MNLKNKKVLFAGWGNENNDDTYMYQIYYLMLKKVFPKLKVFDTKKNYFQHGKYEMNNLLLEKINIQKPELIIFALNYDELSLQIFNKIKQSYPETKIAIIICDDDARFDNWSRYYALFFDSVITSQDFLKEYKEDGIKNVFFHWDYNTYKLNPMNLKKVYDVTFIGRPKADRNKIFKYLLDNGINLSLFGWEWNEYPEFKEIYKGPLNQEDYAKVINQSKINLSPTRAGYYSQKKRFNMKGRFFEVSLCKSFQLIEDFPVIHKFFGKNEIGLFKTKEDLVKKINYYLKHEKEREEMAKRAYEKVINNYNREKQLNEIFSKIIQIKNSFKEKKSDKKIKVLTKKELFLPSSKITKKLRNSNYVCFDIGKNEKSPYKDYLQVKSIEKTNMPISCCDYYVSFFGSKEDMLFHSKVSFERIGKQANKLINLNQLMVKRDFFLKNFSLFKKLAKCKVVDLINLENTAFVSIPLVTVNKINVIKYDNMEKSFYMKFQDNLLTIFYQKKFYQFYLYRLLFSGIFGKKFILKYLIESFSKKSNWDKLDLNKSYFRGSIIGKYTK